MYIIDVMDLGSFGGFLVSSMALLDLSSIC
jgi:hypothetical protein